MELNLDLPLFESSSVSIRNSEYRSRLASDCFSDHFLPGEVCSAISWLEQPGVDTNSFHDSIYQAADLDYVCPFDSNIQKSFRKHTQEDLESIESFGIPSPLPHKRIPRNLILQPCDRGVEALSALDFQTSEEVETTNEPGPSIPERRSRGRPRKNKIEKPALAPRRRVGRPSKRLNS